MQSSDLQVIKDIPGYKVILKAVLKAQIQQLVENLAENTGEESVILTASVSDGSLSHLGSDAGKSFLEDHEDIKSQFLGFCLKHHHKKKQLEQEKKEREEREKQLQQQQLQDPGGGMLMAPTTPTRFGPGPRPRFSPSRVQPSPRQFSPRGVHPVSLTRASPRGGGVRHEPYPGARPRKPLNFDPNRRPQPSPMRLPTDPSNSAQKPIKIEAMDDDDDNADKTQSEQPKSVDSGKGDSGGEPAATDSASPAPPHTPTDSIHSPAVRDDGDESSSSTIVNEPSEVKYSDTLPPGGLSLDSDLSNLMGTPSETAKSDTSASDSAALDPNVSVKLEAVGDDDDLEIMGVEPGQMPQPDYGLMPNLQQQMGFGPSTSGAQGGMGDQSSQGYSDVNQSTKKAKTRHCCVFCRKAFPSNSKLTRHVRIHTGEKPYTCEFCGKSFNAKGNLKSHQSTHFN